MRPLRIAFVRPRLGIGGSERLVVDAARELLRRGHQASIFAPAVAGAPELDLVRDGQVPVMSAGGRLPTDLAGRMRAPCALIRAAFASLQARRMKPQLVFCDVVAHVVPLLRRLTRAKVVFYCHYPDQLLTAPGQRTRSAYRIYRRPLDRLEARGLAAADALLVNSRFTLEALGRTFRGLGAPARVVYPAIEPAPTTSDRTPPSDGEEIRLISVARFDPRKGLALALEALLALRQRLAPQLFERVRLVFAGHLEPAWPESRRTLEVLRAQARAASVGGQVSFLISPSDAELAALVRGSHAIVYTPAFEHFGYVPLEAMAAGRPVVAAHGGGPAETILDGETGLLCAPVPEAFADALAGLIRDPERARRMGEAGRRHVERHFSLRRFGDDLERVFQELLDVGEERRE